MGRLFIESLNGPKIFKCKCCKVDSASHDDIISKDFQGRFGRAYLFKNVESVFCPGLFSWNSSGGSLPEKTVAYVKTYLKFPWEHFRVNISLGPNEDRQLMSGLHTVNDIYCSSCQQILGWRYEKAYEESEKYKEGLFILEKERMLKDGW